MNGCIPHILLVAQGQVSGPTLQTCQNVAVHGMTWRVGTSEPRSVQSRNGAPVAPENAGQPKAFSVVVPTRDMCAHLPVLWSAMCSSGLAELADEILIVDDGSTDQTLSVIAELQQATPLAAQKLRVLSLGRNEGRFHARLAGARAIRTTHLLFLDSRVTLGNDFAKKLSEASRDYEAINGCVDIDVTRNVLCLYWERSHRAIFRKHYAETVRPVTLTSHNFDQYLKGTGVFFCPTAQFIQSCEPFEQSDLLSDDTFLMKTMVATCPITIHPEVRVQWVPREDFRQFVWRIWDRGPQFAEYHLHERRGLFFWLFMLEVAGLIALLAMLFFMPYAALVVMGTGLVALFLSAILLAKSPWEFVRMAPLHALVALTFATAALHGWWVVLRRKRPSRRG